MNFPKSALAVTDLRQRWEERGMHIPAPKEAEHYLRFIGYYRLSAYALPLQTEGSTLPNRLDKPFKYGICFEDLLNLYRFDRDLRMLFMDAIERIEVGVRTLIVDEMSLLHGPHWFMDPNHFKNNIHFSHSKLIQKIKQGLHISHNSNFPTKPHHEVFINHYYNKYSTPNLPPAWMVAETLTLGTWSLVFENLSSPIVRKCIAGHLNTDAYILKNWLHALTYLRNLCAHHARLWNRKFVIKPVIAQRHKAFLHFNDRCYAMAVVVEDLLRQVAPGTQWATHLQVLMQRNIFVNPTAMGFPSGWYSEPFWKLT